MARFESPRSIAPERVRRRPSALVLDVREYGARGSAPFRNVLRIAMSDLSDRLLELPHETLHIVCEDGLKSRRVASYLEGQGFEAVVVAGGLLASSRDEDIASGLAAL